MLLRYHQLWELASQVPEAGVRKIEYVEYDERPDPSDADWLSDIVPDVFLKS